MKTTPPRLVVFNDRRELTAHAAREILQTAAESIRDRGRFRISLAGGSTPRELYKYLAGPGREAMEPSSWESIHVFWGDERHAPPDHTESNYRMARETLLDHVPIPPANIHRIHGEELDAADAAQAYEHDLRMHFDLRQDDRPRFDVVLLGMGADGHTASLFPGSEAVLERKKLVMAPWVERLRAHRITLTPPVFNHAAKVIFLVAGGDKAVALGAVLEGDPRPDLLPAQAIRPVEGELLWLVDRPAARLLKRES